MAAWNRRRRKRALTLEALEDRCLLSYAITDLGTLPGGTTSEAFGLNNADPVQVIGQANTGQVGSGFHAFLWDSVKGMQDLGTLGGSSSAAAGINDAGQVVGWSATGTAFSETAFLWDSINGMQDLGKLPGAQASRAFAINDLGQVVGWSGDTYFVNGHAVLWDSGTLADLGTINDYPSTARAINANSQIVGNAGPIDGNHALLWDNGTTQDLGGSSSFGSTAAGINHRGHITGITYVEPQPGLFLSNPYLYTEEFGLTDIATTDFCPSGWSGLGGGAGINDHNQIVGYLGCFTIQPQLQDYTFPAVWTPGQGWLSLRDAIPPDSGWTLYEATAINNQGQIVGYGLNPAGQTSAYLLTPDEGGAPGRFLSRFLGNTLALEGPQIRNLERRIVGDGSSIAPEVGASGNAGLRQVWEEHSEQSPQRETGRLVHSTLPVAAVADRAMLNCVDDSAAWNGIGKTI